MSAARAPAMSPPFGGRPEWVWGVGAAGLAAATTVALGPVALAVPAALGVTVLLLRHPAPLLVAYLYVGVFKGEAVLKHLPFDITLALGILLVGVCAHRVLTGRGRRPPVGLVGLVLFIGLFLAVSLIWTPVPDYGAEKVAKFFTFTAVAVAAPFFVIETRRDLRVLLWSLVTLAVFGALISLALPGSTSESGRVEFGGNENTIYNSRLLCSGALVLLLAPGLGLSRRLSVIAPVLGLGVVAVAASVGNRGAVFSLVFALACVVTASVLKRPRQLFYVLIIVAVGIAVFPLVSLPETSRQRLQQSIERPVGTLEEDGRSRLYGKAIELAEAHPVFGFGSGGFFLYSYVLMDQEEKYPHNMFLELAAEVGFGPALALGAAVIFVLSGLGRRLWQEGGEIDRRLLLVVSGLLLFNLFSIQFSGDINDNRTFWAWFGLSWLLARYGVPAGRTDLPQGSSPAASGR